jgi:hypothetical protein
MNELMSGKYGTWPLVWCGFALLVLARSAPAQVLVANDDGFGIPYGETLVVEAFGVLDNDTLDGEAAGENGATAELVVDASHGTLELNPDGSFSYSPGSGFDGLDSFIYRAVFDSVSDQATVTLIACTGGPQIFECWNEAAFLSKAAEFGLGSFEEGFEDDAAWGIARSPDSAASVVSQGIRWTSNHPDFPAFNEITTGTGPARTGLWGVFDPDHGYATGTPFECDVDNPPAHCLYHDGVTGTVEPGMNPLRGVGGYITGIYGANIAIALDGAAPVGGGQISGGHQFFGLVDASEAGFTRFEFRELDSKVGQALFVFGDDFTLLTSIQTAVQETQPVGTRIFFAGAGPNPSSGNTTLRFTLPAEASVQLGIYDQRGRLVQQLASEFHGAGTHAVHWNGRDSEGRNVAAGIYFGRLIVTRGAQRDVLVRKLMVMH